MSEEHEKRTTEGGAQPGGRASVAERARSARPRARTCVGCGERVDVTAAGRASLVRLILGPEGEVAVDPGDGGFGRGAHVHPRPDCLAKAVQRGLAKAAKGRVHSIQVGEGAEGLAPLRPDTLAAAIKAAMDRRVEGLLAAAGRSRQVALGSDAVTGACERGEAGLVVVACDAAAAADLTEVRRAIGEGRAVSWGTKQSLGALFGGGEAARPSGVGVLAITSASIAAAARDAVQIADESSGRAAPREKAVSRPRREKSLKEKAGGLGAEPSLLGEPPSSTSARAGGSRGGAQPRHESRKNARQEPRKDHRKGDRRGSRGRGDNVGLGVAAGAAANRRVDG